ncbi:MAG: TetR/AcrR family transcriptional regulator, partial [Acidobacteria bacterium]|nr:TetR/AcrR family transcriptional regulator [Acidobacteriota bacterium]
MSQRTPAPTRTRDPKATRDAILQAATREIHTNGFRSAGLDSILAEAGVTKGALYHHFGSKHELGLAVLEESVRRTVL